MKVEHINKRVEETVLAYNKLKKINGEPEALEEVMAGWTRPTETTMKINVDGASQSFLGHTKVGIVAKDHNGKWLMAKERNVGRLGSLTIGLLAIFFGLKLAWKINYRIVILESVSIESIKHIMGIMGT